MIRVKKRTSQFAFSVKPNLERIQYLRSYQTVEATRLTANSSTYSGISAGLAGTVSVGTGTSGISAGAVSCTSGTTEFSSTGN